MNNYTLELLADNTTEAKQKSCEEIIQRTNNFCTNYFTNHSESVNDSTIERLFYEIKQGAFWRMLCAVDGFYKNNTDQNTERRARGAKNFNRQELQEILNICANYATLAPVQENWPGTYKGHKILYEELIKKENSIFQGAANTIQKQRLNNSKFWEMLPDMTAGLNSNEAYFVVEEVLTNHFEDLTTHFAPKGF